MEIKYTVSLDEANLIIAGLTKLPYELVNNLIIRLKQDGDQQFIEYQNKQIEATTPTKQD